MFHLLRLPRCIIAALGVVVLAGCGDDKDTKSNESANKDGPGGIHGMLGGGQIPNPARGGLPANVPGDGTAVQPPVEATTDNTGRKGRDYGGGIISEPIAAMFRVQDKLNFQFIMKDLQLYEALHGHRPRSQQEFEEQIIKPGQRKMPLARNPNMKTIYNPQTGKLALVPNDGAQ